MKKLFLLIPLILVAVGCAPEPEKELDPIDTSNTEVTYYTAKLTPENSLITAEDTTAAYTVHIPSVEDPTTIYDIEIGSPMYLSTKAHEFIMKPGSYLKSVSTFTVDRIIVDFFGSKGTNYAVHAGLDASTDALVYHSSSIAAEDPDDGGIVYEYSIQGPSWYMNNISDVQKPGIYSVTVIFSK